MDNSVKHVSIVISPLIALMADQSKELTSIGIASLAYDPNMPKDIAEGTTISASIFSSTLYISHPSEDN